MFSGCDFFDENNNQISPHTIKKFELISEYVKAWVYKLLNYSQCNGVVYIDCMSNNGIYHDKAGNTIEGTPILVTRIIADAMKDHTEKNAYLYFNDIDKKRIETLKQNLPTVGPNVHVLTRDIDGNDLLREISSRFNEFPDMNFLLVYDPYQASIDWEAIMPYLRNWGEVILNHMISDPIRGAKMAKRPESIEKYENTYLTSIEQLVSFGSDKAAFEKRIKEIILALSQKANRKKYYIASYPFFNTANTVVYNLIHCTSNIEGFKLYKKTAWKTFGDKSSMKDTHGKENQLSFDFDSNEPTYSIQSDAYCYYLDDIAAYVQNEFCDRKDVPLNEIWNMLDEHPVFTAVPYKTQIKSLLESVYSAKVGKSSITFTDRKG